MNGNRTSRTIGVMGLAAALIASAITPAAASERGRRGVQQSLAWGSPQSIDTHALVAIKCPGPSLCLAVDSAGHFLITKHPRAGASGWHRLNGAPHLDALSCPSVRLCVGVAGRAVWTSTKPTVGSSWKRTRIDSVQGSYLSAIGCRFTLCVAGDSQANAFVSTHPTAGRRAWKRLLLPSNGDSPGILSGIACPGWSLCVAVDQSTGEGFIDDVFTSTHPTRPSSWNITTTFTFNSFDGIACPSKSLCVAPTGFGAVMTSTNPARGGSWHATTLLSTATPINAVACASTSFCILGDDTGAVEASTNPTGGAAAWSTQTIAPGDAIESLACLSARLCFAVTRHGNLIASS